MSKRLRKGKPSNTPRFPRFRCVDWDKLEKGTLEWRGKEYMEDLQKRNYALPTILDRIRNIGYLIEWLQERELTLPEEITPAILEQYQSHLYRYRSIKGRPLSVRSQYGRLSSIRFFFSWLTKKNFCLFDPAHGLELPRLPKTLPGDVLNPEEVDAILNQPDTDTPFGFRDRCILEMFYATGIRRLEMSRLKIHDIDYHKQTVFVRQGKGKKDRIIPASKRALQWLSNYVSKIRPLLSEDDNETGLFLNYQGEPLHHDKYTQIVKGYIRQAGIHKDGACHLFRHSCATLMLDNGADIRHVQEMLGHASIGSTQIYTRVSITKLQEVYNKTHPANQAQRRRNKKTAKNKDSEE